MIFKRTWGPEPHYNEVIKYKRPNDDFIVVAGPCSVESTQQIHSIAEIASVAGATHLRGGVFRAGTYPGKNFGWVNKDLIGDYQSSAHMFGLKNIIEILDYRDEWIFDYADCVQVGARGMQNYTLLKVVAQSGKPVFLKRATNATIDEFLGAAEWLLHHGCKDITLIERGSVGFATHVRWDLSISMIPAVKAITNMPIIVDASHGTGRRDLVEPMTLAGVAAGADGLLCEFHTDPDKSLSDSEQALDPEQFVKLIKRAREIKNGEERRG